MNILFFLLKIKQVVHKLKLYSFFFSRTLRSTLHVWLDAFPEDFRDPPEYPLLNQFLTFCEQHAKDSEIHFKVKHRMERLIKHPEPGKRN